jgi:hypothetical protein
MTHDDDDLDYLDCEPGHIEVPPANPQLVKACAWFFLALVLVSYVSEYQQEAAVIQHLKLTHPLSDECLSVGPGNWLERASGLHAAKQQICDEQNRIAALSPYPNLLVVFVTLPWRCVMGDTPIQTITLLLASQSYVISVCLIFAGSCVSGLLIYHVFMALPKFVSNVVQARDVARVQRYEAIQQLLRPPPKIRLIQVQAKQRSATLLRRQPLCITQEV